MADSINQVREDIRRHPTNQVYAQKGWQPLFEAGEQARVIIIGQAPGIKAQQAGLAWGDASGQRLMQWLGITEEVFRDVNQVALIPMDFYYPGKGKSGDLPPRRDFAPLWHPRLLALMPRATLKVLIGTYAQGYYLGKDRQRNLTETVRAYQDYLPGCFPLVHPSPLNFRWQMKNPWFEAQVLPALQERVRQALSA